MKNQFLMRFNLLVVLVAFFFITNRLLAQQENTPIDIGQSEAIKETAFKFNDKETGANVTIFESVLNGTRKSQNKCNEMRFFISPVFYFVPFDKEGTQLYNRIDGDNFVTYQFNLLNYHTDLFKEAADIINRNFLNDCQYKITAPDRQVSIMTHSLITFKIKSTELEDCYISPLGEIGSPHNLDNHTGIEVKVPKKLDLKFQAFLNSPIGLTIESSIHFNAIDIKMSSKSWTVADIENTEAYKDLDTKGKEYVSAEQVQQMLRGVARNLKYYEFQDPSLDISISNKSDEIFNKFLAQLSTTAVDDIQKAKEIDEKLRVGTGLTAEQFKPVEIMRQMTESVINETDYKKANEIIKNICHDQSNTISGSAGAGYGPFSASLGYSKTSKELESNFFKNQDEFMEFKSTHSTESGGKLVIVERGIKLLDKTTFKNNINFAAEQILVQPVSTAKKWTVTSQTKSINESFEKYKNELLNVTSELNEAKADFVPIGTIITFAGKLENLPDEVKQRYKVCDGSALNREDFFLLFNSIKTYWGAGDGITTFNIPDLQGIFLRGVSDLSQRDEEKGDRISINKGGNSGNNIGSYQDDKLGTHTHLIYDPGHFHIVPLGSGWASGGKDQYARGDAGFDRQFPPSKGQVTGIKILGNENAGKDTRPKNAYVYFLIKVK